MTAKVVWLFVFVVLYWSYCIFWGIRGARLATTASDYFIAGRKLSLWVFVLAATATSFSGWTFMGHPGLIYRDGFQYAFASFYAITIPFTGVVFLKRQWMLGKRYGYVTPGEMLADYFQGHVIRVLTVVVALLFSIPYLGVQLGASGYLFNVLTITPAYPTRSGQQRLRNVGVGARHTDLRGLGGPARGSLRRYAAVCPAVVRNCNRRNYRSRCGRRMARTQHGDGRPRG